MRLDWLTELEISARHSSNGDEVSSPDRTNVRVRALTSIFDGSLLINSRALEKA